MTLYQIDREIEEIYDKAVDPETGELLDEEIAWDRLDELNMERERKIETVAEWHKNTQSEIREISYEIASLQKRKRRLEKKADWIEAYLRDALDGQKFETARVEVSFRKSTYVYIPDVDFAERYADFPFVKTTVTYTVDKPKLRQLLQSGAEVAGAELHERENITIR